MNWWCSIWLFRSIEESIKWISVFVVLLVHRISCSHFEGSFGIAMNFEDYCLLVLLLLRHIVLLRSHVMNRYLWHKVVVGVLELVQFMYLSILIICHLSGAVFPSSHSLCMHLICFIRNPDLSPCNTTCTSDLLWIFRDVDKIYNITLLRCTQLSVSML